MIKDYGSGWSFSIADFKIGLGTHDYERKLLGIPEQLTAESLFPAFVYSILSAAQNTTTLVKIFERLRRKGFLNPTNVREENFWPIVDILKHTHFPSQKITRFCRLGEWWVNNQELVEQIVDNANGRQDRTVELRNKLAEAQLSGVRYKVASFIMQLSIMDPAKIPVVVIDKWLIKFLYDIKLADKVPDYRTVSGFQPREYLRFEVKLSDMARGLGLSPSQFGLMIWCKAAYYEPNRCLFDYMELKA